eukprot:762497-Hanusia_phi.AAC.4
MRARLAGRKECESEREINIPAHVPTRNELAECKRVRPQLQGCELYAQERPRKHKEIVNQESITCFLIDKSAKETLPSPAPHSQTPNNTHAHGHGHTDQGEKAPRRGRLACFHSRAADLLHHSCKLACSKAQGSEPVVIGFSAAAPVGSAQTGSLFLLHTTGARRSCAAQETVTGETRIRDRTRQVSEGPQRCTQSWQTEA